MEAIGKIFILAGILFLIIGLILTFGKYLAFGSKLPGDIIIQKKNFTLYFPISTSILLSILLSLIYYFLSKK
ncbi:MAG: DUF2905 family protein [bacterium]